MIRRQVYLMLALISITSLLLIAMLLLPQAVRINCYNRFNDEQSAMCAAINPLGLSLPGKLNDFKSVEHSDGY